MPPIPMPIGTVFGGTPTPAAVNPLQWAPGSTMQYPAGPSSSFHFFGEDAPFNHGYYSVPGEAEGAASTGAKAAATGAAESGAEAAGFMGLGSIPLSASLGFPLLGQLAGGALNKIIPKGELNSIAGGAARGAGLLAPLGLAGGPFAELTVPAAAGIGAIGGGLISGLHLSSLFKGKDNSVSDYHKKKDAFENLMQTTLGNDTDSAALIQKQLGFQAAVISGDSTLSKSDKAKKLSALIDSGNQLLAQYVANPAQFRAQAQQALDTSTGPTQSNPFADIAMQNVISGVINPIADQISATGKQEAAAYGEYGKNVGGARGGALTSQGLGMAAAADNVANAYRAQAALLPAKYIYDQYGVPQPSSYAAPQTSSGSSSGGTNPAMDQILAQLSGSPSSSGG